MTKSLNIAIVSTNLNKYSETFIHNHVRCLKGEIHLLVNGYLPTEYSTDGGKTTHLFVGRLKQIWLTLKLKGESNTQQYLKRAIEKYLVQKKINVILCEYGPSGVELMDIAKKLAIPLVVHFHGYDAYRNDILSTYGLQYPQLFGQANKLIVVSNHMFQQMQKLGCDESKLRLLTYGIDTQLFQKKSDTEKKFTFVACGRFVAKKSPNNVVLAFCEVLKTLPNAQLLMIGDGELLQLVKVLVNELQISNSVHFTGALNQSEIAKCFQQSQVFVQHSITTVQNDSEGTPLAILESAACGLPCVATAHAGIKEVVEHNATGFLVPEGDVKAMAKYMIELAVNSEKCEAMGKAASERILLNNTLEIYTAELQQLLCNEVNDRY